jgi:hypothetical protein
MKLKLTPGWGDVIKAIEMEGGEFSYVVGQGGVTAINVEPMDLGHYSLLWFRVLCGNDLVARVNASSVRQVCYFDEGEAP